MLMKLRALVSKNKRRFRQYGYDLDLSYIVSKRIIAMGFPSEGTQGYYRNPMSEVVRFLTEFHDHHFKIYNFCSERVYDANKFAGRVEHFPFDDHQAVPLNVVGDFCRSAHAWLDADPKNVVVCHCKAGKGRTGLMVCSYLLYKGWFTDPDRALQFYGEKRTKNGKGVTIASQRRYVRYFYEVMTQGPRPVNELKLTRIKLSSNCVEVQAEERTSIFFEISSNRGNGMYKMERIVSSLEDRRCIVSGYEKSGRDFIIDVSPVWLQGDVRVQLFEKTFFGQSSRSLFYFWFNTSFVYPGDPLEILRDELDKPMKGLDAETQIQLIFEESRQSSTNVLSVGDVLSLPQRETSFLPPSPSPYPLKVFYPSASAKVQQLPDDLDDGSDLSRRWPDLDDSGDGLEAREMKIMHGGSAREGPRRDALQEGGFNTSKRWDTDDSIDVPSRVERSLSSMLRKTSSGNRYGLEAGNGWTRGFSGIVRYYRKPSAKK